MNPLILFGYMLRAALLSTGGLGNVAGLHNALVKPGMTSDAKFVESITVGQISPGPNGLWVVSLGYLMLGWAGALVSLAGILIPPMLVLAVERLYSRVKHHPAVEGFVVGLTLAVVGTVVSVLVKLLQGVGTDGVKLSLAALAFVLGWIPKLPVILVFVVCGLIGFLASR